MVIVAAVLFAVVVLGAPSDPLEQRVAAFNAWLLPKAPAASNALRVFAHPNLRIGAQATRDIRPDEVYHQLPAELIISRATAFASPLRELLLELERRERRRMDFEVLLLFLVRERRLGAASAWAPYLDLLPGDYSHAPVHFDDATLRELQVSLLHGAIKQMIAADRAAFEQLTSKLAAIATAPRDLGAAPLSRAEFDWAAGVLNSRRIWFNNEGHLIPLLDAVNCRSRGAARPHRTEPAPDGGCLTRATRAFRAGDEVFEDYGQPNHIYFRYHGFVLDDNPHDCVLVPDPAQQVQRCVKHPSQLAAWGMSKATLVSRLAQYASKLESDEHLLAELQRPGRDLSLAHQQRASVVHFRTTEKRLLRSLIDMMGHTEL